MLALSVYRKTALLISVVIILFFLFVISYTTITNKLHDCGCFGNLLSISATTTILKNILILFMIFLSLKFEKHNSCLDTKSVRKFVLMAIFSILFCIIRFFNQPVYNDFSSNKELSDIERLGIETQNGDNNISLFDNKLIAIVIRDTYTIDNKTKEKLKDFILSTKYYQYNSIYVVTNTDKLGMFKTDIPVCIADNASITSVLPSMFGILIFDKGMLKGRWMQNSFGTHKFPQETGYIINHSSRESMFKILLFWTFIFFVVIICSYYTRVTEKR